MMNISALLIGAVMASKTTQGKLAQTNQGKLAQINQRGTLAETETEYHVCEAGVDSFGDGCWWYGDYKESCGEYDSDCFTASTECCEC
jgi:hypothetical protein